MFMRTGVCQSQGQVVRPPMCTCVCVCACKRDLLPHLLCLYLYPYPHLGSISLESAHNIKCWNTFTNTRTRTHLSKAAVDHEPRMQDDAEEPSEHESPSLFLAIPPSFVSALRLQSLFQFIPLFTYLLPFLFGFSLLFM